MFHRQTEGSVVCSSCGTLVGVRDERCLNCGRRNPGLWGYAPLLRRLGNDLGFAPLVIGTCVVLYLLTLLFSGSQIRMQGLLGLLSPATPITFVFGASGALPVFELGRWWTVLSAGWLHGSVLHVLFNMLWVRQLAPATADLYGPGRAVIIYVVAGVCGFAASSLAGATLEWMPLPFLRGAQLTLGASASLFGMLGALVYYGRRSGSRAVHGQAMSYAITLGLFGLIMPGIDNFAHAGGFAGGYLVAQWMDPLLPERIDHLGIALGCLVASALAIVVSILTGVRYL